MHGLKSESCLRAHDECGIRFERQFSRPKCPQNLERSSFDITLVGTAGPQPTNFEPLPTRLPTLPKNNCIVQKPSAQTSPTFPSPSSTTKPTTKTQPQAPQKREIMRGFAHCNKRVLHPTHITTITSIQLSKIESQHPTHMSKFHIQNFVTYEQN